MQIGVASQISGITPEDAPLARIESMTHRQPPEYDNYYVVDTVDEAGKPRRLYYNTDQVERVDGNDDGSVDIWLFSPGCGPSIQVRHQPATVTRRDQLVDDLYTLTTGPEGATQTVQYRGNTFLVDELELPYRFIVDVRVPLEDLDNVKLDKVRSIINLEIPAHTMYYLKLTPVVSEYVLQPMQIGVRSTIGLDTIAG